MIRTLAITQEGELIEGLPLQELRQQDVEWVWVDYDCPTPEEIETLETHFHFHPLAIEDCLHFLQRPKLDHYDNAHFFVLHAMDEKTLTVEEIDIFLGTGYVVTYHSTPSHEINTVWDRYHSQKQLYKLGPLYVSYMVIDKLVDEYFPSIQRIEDELADIESNEDMRNKNGMNQVFKIRSELLKLRRTMIPTRDLLYRVVNSHRIEGLNEQLVYFSDIYDHLLKLSEMIDSNRDMTADFRDSYVSFHSARMNNIMKTLTVITTIFMPLTFIAGVYGMNFGNMPELTWHYGYFMAIGLMLFIGVGLYAWFRRKGWFD